MATINATYIVDIFASIFFMSMTPNKESMSSRYPGEIGKAMGVQSKQERMSLITGPDDTSNT